jgi:hypothetical protein
MRLMSGFEAWLQSPVSATSADLIRLDVRLMCQTNESDSVSLMGPLKTPEGEDPRDHWFFEATC